MNEDIEKIIKYFKNDAWFTIFNAKECNDEPYKLLNPIEVNQMIDYMNKLQNNWNELKKWLEECLNEIKQNDVYDRTSYEQGQIIALESSIAKAQELEQGKDEKE